MHFFVFCLRVTGFGGGRKACFCSVKDEGVLRELLVVKRIQLPLILILRV